MNKLTVTVDNHTYEVEVDPDRAMPGEFTVIGRWRANYGLRAGL